MVCICNEIRNSTIHDAKHLYAEPADPFFAFIFSESKPMS